jgi:hypothetical protein
MTEIGHPETKADEVPSRRGLHEWAERIAVPNFDFIADPIEAVVDGLAHVVHHEGDAAHRPDDRSAERPA